MGLAYTMRGGVMTYEDQEGKSLRDICSCSSICCKFMLPPRTPLWYS